MQQKQRQELSKKHSSALDPDSDQVRVTGKVTDVLGRGSGWIMKIYSDIKANPTIENVQNGVAAFKAAKADYIIAIGGGSSMDTAKAIGIIIANPQFEDVRSHWRAWHRQQNPVFRSLPFRQLQEQLQKLPSTM